MTARKLAKPESADESARVNRAPIVTGPIPVELVSDATFHAARQGVGVEVTAAHLPGLEAEGNGSHDFMQALCRALARQAAREAWSAWATPQSG